MDTAEPLRPSAPDPDPSVPLQDIRFTLADRRDLQVELAAVFSNQRAVESILRSTSFSRGRIPAFENSSAEEVWGEILLELQLGAIRSGNYQLLTAVIRPYPDNHVFRRLAETYLPVAADPAAPSQAAEPTGSERPAERDEPDDGEAAAVAPAERLAAVPEQEAEPPACHVIVRASTEEIREEASRVLRELGLDPQEQWSTAHAVSYRVNSTRTDHVRRQLEQTDFGWTVVAPGLRDYLLHAVYIEGPDGRQFRITDAPAQQTVGNLAAEVIDQYGGALPNAARAAVIDRVGPDGQGHRLDPSDTLDEAQVRDGDRMRVGFQAKAAAINPLDRQDALYRVRNQIRDFGDTREPEAEFVVLANSVLLPTEYELEFTQPSFGPPPSADAPPADISRHRVLIQLGSDFPETPPMVFWLTQIYHPNVWPTYESDQTRGNEAQMGLVCLGALQESYLPSLDFGALCQMLMDIAGFRNYSLFKLDGSVDARGQFRRRVDFYDAAAAEWVGSADGQRRIAEIKGAPAAKQQPQRPEYRNVIERIGGE